MDRISKKRFYVSLVGEIVTFIVGICTLHMTFMNPEYDTYYALLTIWMYIINKDFGKITEQYLKQEQENEFTR